MDEQLQPSCRRDAAEQLKTEIYGVDGCLLEILLAKGINQLNDICYCFRWRAMRSPCSGHWISCKGTVTSTWRCSSMHLGVLSRGCLGRCFPAFPLCIPLSPTSQLKNQQFDQGFLSDSSLSVPCFLLIWVHQMNGCFKFQSCSILSKYGVHGFPTIFLMNSTMRVWYHGTRSLNSLVAFYNDVTGKHFHVLHILFYFSPFLLHLCNWKFSFLTNWLSAYLFLVRKFHYIDGKEIPDLRMCIHCRCLLMQV